MISLQIVTGRTAVAAVCTLVLAVFFGGGTAMSESGGDKDRSTRNVQRIVVTYDNYIHTEGLRPEWGFSCWIETDGKTILFDTGGEGEVLLSNMKALGLDLKDVDLVFVSHDHWDHTGGLDEVLAENADVPVYFLSSFSKEFKGTVDESGAESRPVKGEMEILPGCFTTGAMGSSIREQSLILNTPDGAIVITGCAHPGIVDIVRKAQDMVGENVALVFGGFHLVRTSDKTIDRIVEDFKKLGVRRVGPSHCTGDSARERFAAKYGDDFVALGVGYEFTFAE